jgi:hypothetical protein
VESIISRWHQPNRRHARTVPVARRATPEFPIPHNSPTFSTSSPSFPSRQPLDAIKESPKSPTLTYSPKDTQVANQVPQFDLTPPSSEPIEAARVRGRRSFFDASDDDLAFGDMSLLDLAELHLTLSPESGSPQIETSFEKPPEQPAPEPVDVKPDIQSLLARLQAIKDRSKAVPYVHIKTELKSP